MKTAVEWLIETHFGSIENCTPDFRNKIKQANKMFEQQIIEACNQEEFFGSYGYGICDDLTKGEQYYNETFKKGKGL
jgi:hypothetical protein